MKPEWVHPFFLPDKLKLTFVAFQHLMGLIHLLHIERTPRYSIQITVKRRWHQ